MSTKLTTPVTSRRKISWWQLITLVLQVLPMIQELLETRYEETADTKAHFDKPSIRFVRNASSDIVRAEVIWNGELVKSSSKNVVKNAIE